MAQSHLDSPGSSLELRFKRWTAVGVVCFLGLLAALPFRSTPSASGNVVAPSHRERSLRFRAEAATRSASARDPSSREKIFEPEAKPTPARTPVTQRMSPEAVPPESSVGLRLADERAPLPQVEASVEEPPLVVARRGENLMDIAERVLGDRRRWKELMDLNPQYRSAFDDLREGQEIAVSPPR